VRNAVSLGGDGDTLACIAGAGAEAFHGGMPEPIRAEVQARLTPAPRSVVAAFERRYR
jgi:ADP-ribosylglycohydrolase